MLKSTEVTASKFAVLDIDTSENETNKNSSKKKSNKAKANKKAKEKVKKDANRKEVNELRSLAFGGKRAAKNLIPNEFINEVDDNKNTETVDKKETDLENSNLAPKIESSLLNNPVNQNSKENSPTSITVKQQPINIVSPTEGSLIVSKEVVIAKLEELQQDNIILKSKLDDTIIELENVKLRNSLLNEAMILGEMKDKKDLVLEIRRLTLLNDQLNSFIITQNQKLNEYKGLNSDVAK